MRELSFHREGIGDPLSGPAVADYTVPRRGITAQDRAREWQFRLMFTNRASAGNAVCEEFNARFAYLVRAHLGNAYTLAHWLKGNNADADRTRPQQKLHQLLTLVHDRQFPKGHRDLSRRAKRQSQRSVPPVSERCHLSHSIGDARGGIASNRHWTS